MLEGTTAAAVDLVSSYLKGDAKGSQAASMDVNLFNFLRYIYIPHRDRELGEVFPWCTNVSISIHELPSTVLRE